MDAVNGMVQAQEQAEALTKHAQVKIDSLLLALLDMPKAVWYLERPDVVVSVAPRSDSPWNDTATLSRFWNFQ